MNAASANVELWLELANALILVAAIVFLLGGALGAIVTVLVQRRAAARRQRGWLKALRVTDEERGALLGDRKSEMGDRKKVRLFGAWEEESR